MDQENSNPKVSRLIFDDSIENHFKAMYTISNLCGLAREKDDFDATELQRLSSTITFWREWRQYCYEPRVCRFASAVGGLRGRDVVDGVSLPQFSSANVPKVEKLSGDNSSSETRKDVVLYAGGPVWALDWCPSSHQNSDHQFNCQFLAVAAHPPNSSYHKIGAPVNGIGVVQIWCLLNMNLTEEKLPPLKKPKGRPKKEPAIDPANQSKDKGALCSLKKQKERPKKVLGVKRPRGRPKKENTTQDPTKEIATDDPTYQSENKEELPSPKKQRGRPRKKNAISDMVNSVNVDMEEEESLFSMKLREKPSKKNAIKDLAAWKEKKSTSDRSTKSKAIKETVNNLDEDSQFIPALSVEFPEDSSGYFGLTKLNTQKSSVTNSNRAAAQKTRNEAIQKNDSCHTSPHLLTKQGDNEFSIAVQEEQKSCADALTSQEVPSNNRYFEKCCDISPCPLTQNDDNRYSIEAHQEAKSYGQVETASSEKVPNNGSFDNRTTTTSVPEELALPRPVFFLEHNGKVAWDVKWRPYSHSELECKHRMGYLAVLLGNGSLEVWEVPSPNAVKIMYSSCRKEGNDPRFLKLESVFKCSNLKWGDKQSIPLTLEWSPSLPHDLLLVGCHDGTVGLWKFSTIGSYQDTRPLLSFSADIAPIRALAWYPDGRDTESANVILTAGHSSLKFWDIRDPYRPLWDLNPVNKIIYSVDWLPDPRCVILTYDDCTLMIITLPKAASDVPVTGKPFTGPHTQGLHCYSNSSLPIWSVQASRQTGMVAYCSSDGTVHHFQLRGRAVENDPIRNRPDQYLCGSLTEEDNTITVNSPLPNLPFSMKKPFNSQNPEDLALALCYNDNPSTLKNKSASKLKTNPSCSVAETQKEGSNDIYPFPSKMVALHKVRWNMNKGSERWLCYGGAAGILRCQEIPLSYF